MSYLIALFCFVISMIIDPMLKMESVVYMLFGWFFIGLGFAYDRKWRKG